MINIQNLINNSHISIPASGASYARLATWYVEHCKKSATEYNYDKAIALAKACDQLHGEQDVTCGFEYHHYKREASPDFLIYCNANTFSSLQSPGIVPKWWPKVQAACIAHPETDLQSSGLYLSCDHWIEFDQGPNGLSMAGIWQMVAQHGLEKPSDWSAICSTIEGWDFIMGDLTESVSVAEFYQAFGFPTQIGIMSGRGRYLKLMKQHLKPESIDAHCHYISRLCPELPGLDFKQYCLLVKGMGHLLRPATNVDIDIIQDRLLPGFGLEIHPPSFLGGSTPDYLNSFLVDGCHVDSLQMEAFTSLMKGLPKGVEVKTPNISGTGIDQCIYVARLNHVKVVFSSDSAPRLKTYVCLVSTYRKNEQG